MSNADISKVYKDRISQIEIDIKKAILNKKWSEVAKLEAEKACLEEYIKS